VERVKEIFGGRKSSAEAASRGAACYLRWKRSLREVNRRSP